MTGAIYTMVPTREVVYAGLLFISVVFSWVMSGVLIDYLKERLV